VSYGRVVQSDHCPPQSYIVFVYSKPSGGMPFSVGAVLQNSASYQINRLAMTSHFMAACFS